MILCISPNPALDRTLVVDNLTAGGVHRATQALMVANGKGLNVARAARAFGELSTCAGFLGGPTGKQVAALAAMEGIATLWTEVEGETRTDVIIVDSSTGDSTVINEPGPTVTARDWERLHTTVMAEAVRAMAICISGSLPPGSPLESYVDLLTSLQMTGRPVWVDVSGKPLMAALAVSGINIKINGDEAQAIFNRPIETPEAALVAAEQLREHGAEIVALTLGKQGAALAMKSGKYWARPPLVKTVCSVGSGDTFLAALVSALLAGDEPRDALRRGVAAGAANAIMLGSGRFDIAAYTQILALTASVEL